MSETGRTTVITGASSGFGAAAVLAFADRGDRVWITTRIYKCLHASPDQTTPTPGRANTR